MTQRLKIVAVSGGLQRPSRTLALVEELLEGLTDAWPAETRLIELGQLVPKFGGVLQRGQLPAEVEQSLKDVESADLLLVASPIYRGSYTGLFKHFFDFVHHESLIDVPVLLAATGGSDRHALAIDHQLRPLFSFFQAYTLPIGVYATDKEFENYRVSGDALRARIALAVQRALPVLRQRASKPVEVPSLAMA
ncbi:FMN reductase [Variovorax sp. OV700]|jgi:FMN reductase|uniref:FMN reductase n=1 Tax=Variovorax sp. OV700 TaxID=1882826 RepID=UPI000880B333|nr:FMN reductase [Variovorax sp. OV700]SDJ54623.1 FMN reductase [Variovorax sp. OV700]